MIDSNNDGIDHINIYSKSQTILGRMLSNFSDHSINTVDGPFSSIEGYWYWLSCKDDKLRTLVGYEAKRVGRELGAKDRINEPLFRLKICHALIDKIINHEEIHKLLITNTLPFKHYYVYNGRVIEPEEDQWVVRFWTFIQKNLI